MRESLTGALPANCLYLLCKSIYINPPMWVHVCAGVGPTDCRCELMIQCYLIFKHVYQNSDIMLRGAKYR